MARKNTIKTDNAGVLQFDSRTKAVMAEFSQAHDIKEKVSSVREVVPGKSNNEIVLVLQFYDYNVEKAIQAYLEDGAKEALTEWQFSGSKAPNKKRKNRKKSGKQNNDSSETPPPSQNGHAHVGGSVLNGILENGIDTATDLSTRVPLSSSIPESGAMASPVTSTPYQTTVSSSSVITTSSTTVPSSAKSEDKTPSSDNPQPQRPPHLQHRQRTHSGSHSHNRQRTASERSTSSADHRPSKVKIHGGLEKSMKDLHRQTVSLERLRMILNEEVDKTYKRIKAVFDEMKTSLNSRELELMTAMDKVKADANNTFASRQKMAADLKVRVDRSESMTDHDLAELRADIKHFVSDRKVDEDIGRTTRFLYDSDFLKEEIGRFGEVVPLKCVYSTRRPSVTSAAIEEPPSPVTPVTPVTPSPSITVVNNSSHTHTENLDPVETHEMAELQKRLKDSLHLQGLQSDSRPSTATSSHSQVSSYRDNNRRNRRRQPQRDYQRGGPPANEGSRRPYSGDNSRPQTGSSPPTIHIGRQAARGGGSSGGRGRGRGSDYPRGRGGRPRSPRKEVSIETGSGGDNHHVNGPSTQHGDSPKSQRTPNSGSTTQKDKVKATDNPSSTDRPKSQGDQGNYHGNNSPKPQRRGPRNEYRSHGGYKGPRGDGGPKSQESRDQNNAKKDNVSSSPEKSKSVESSTQSNGSNAQA